MKVALYVRVSSSDQNSELQTRELRTYAEHHGWEITQEYADTMSAAKASRPAVNRLMADARARSASALRGRYPLRTESVSIAIRASRSPYSAWKCAGGHPGTC
jgi:predicted site-specific integrase-resolvase